MRERSSDPTHSSRAVRPKLTAFQTSELGQRTDLLEELVERLTRDEGGCAVTGAPG